MMEAHDFVNPSFNGLPRFNKPVLSYWLVAASYRLFGVSVGVERFPIAIGALVLIACAFVLARIATDDHRGAAIAGLWAAAGLAADPRLVMFARRIFIDIWISAFLALTLTFFAVSERHSARRRLHLTLMYVSVGLGALTKGPVAIVLPGLTFGLYLVTTESCGGSATDDSRRHSHRCRDRHSVVPALYHQHGWTEIKSFLLTENVERFTAGAGVRQVRGPLFYLPVVFSNLPALANAHRRGGALVVAAPSAAVALWCWIVAIVAFFSLSAGKQDLYIFPIVPAIAALGGIVLAEMRGDSRICAGVRSRSSSRGSCSRGPGGGLVVFQSAGGVYTLNGADTVAAIGIAGGALVTVLALVYRPWQSAALLSQRSSPWTGYSSSACSPISSDTSRSHP